MSELETLRRSAPHVEPLSADAARRVRDRMTRRPRRSPLRLALVPAVALLVVVAAVAVPRRLGGSDPAFAAESIRAAEASPLLLVHGDGWKVTRVDEFAPGTGEISASDGSSSLELAWIPQAQIAVAAFFKAGESDLHESATVSGQQATIYRYSGTNDYVAVWPDGPATVHARGNAESLGAFRGELALIAKASVNEWLAALPSAAVKPADHARVVNGMLADLPIPPGLDVAALTAGSATRDRYQVGAQVAGAVACGWIAQWVDATAHGDAATASHAAAQLATSHGWPVLHDMQAGGAYPEVLWQYADAVAGDGTVVGGKKVTVAESYVQALGCPAR